MPRLYEIESACRNAKHRIAGDRLYMKVISQKEVPLPLFLGKGVKCNHQHF